jgi:hypothetical protein
LCAKFPQIGSVAVVDGSKARPGGGKPYQDRGTRHAVHKIIR